MARGRQTILLSLAVVAHLRTSVRAGDCTLTLELSFKFQQVLSRIEREISTSSRSFTPFVPQLSHERPDQVEVLGENSLKIDNNSNHEVFCVAIMNAAVFPHDVPTECQFDGPVVF